MMNFVPNAVDVFSEWTAKVTTQFIKTYIGKIFLAIVLVGPITFLPTIYQAWTAPDIDALRTSTWPLMILVNISAFVGVARQGDWRLRLTMIIWTVVMIIIWLATLIR